MDSDEKPLSIPAMVDMLREMRRKPPEESARLLQKWLDDAYWLGFNAGLGEGLKRSSEPVKRTTLTEILARQRGTAVASTDGNDRTPSLDPTDG